MENQFFYAVLILLLTILVALVSSLFIYMTKYTYKCKILYASKTEEELSKFRYQKAVKRSLIAQAVTTFVAMLLIFSLSLEILYQCIIAGISLLPLSYIVYEKIKSKNN